MTEIKLSKELYRENEIKKCIEDFSELAEFDLLSGNDKYIIKLFNCKYDEKETSSEFENYLIELSYGSVGYDI